LIDATAAEAWLKENPAEAGTVEVLDKTNLKAEDGVYEVTFNVKEEEATKVTVNVTVKDRDEVVEGEEYAIGANNVTVGIADAQAMLSDDATLISKTKAIAWLKANPSIAATAQVSDKADLKAEVGVYEVTFNVKEEEATKVTVTITVLDKDVIVEGTTYAIGANHITVGKDDVKAMIADDEVLISATAAEAWLKTDYNVKAEVLVSEKLELKAAAGAYEVEFKVASEPTTRVSVIVTVIDKDIVVEGDAYVIGANNITVGKDIAKAMIADDAKLISETKAEAWVKDDYATKAGVLVSDKAALKAETGVYEVTFKVTEDETLTVSVKITVVDKDVIVEGTTYAIGANNITVGIDTAKAFIASDKQLLSATAAEAWLKDDYATKGTALVSDKAALEAKVGSYEVEFAVKEEPETKVKVTITVVDKEEITKGDQYTIGANNIIVGKEDIKGLIAENEALIAAADAEAWLSDEPATKGTVEVLDKTALSEEAGTYEITFNVKEEPETTVKVTITVIDKDLVVEGDVYSIGANNVTIGIEDAKAMLNDDSILISTTKAEAWLKNDYATKAEVLVSDKANLKAEAGVYEVTFKVKDEETTTVTIKVTVIDKDVVEEGKLYAIGANNIVVGKDDVKALIEEDAKLIEATKAEAWLKDDYATKGEAIVSDKADLKAAVGVYEVTFKVKEEPTTQVSVNVEVVDKDVLVEGEEYAIGANNITVGKDDAKAMLADDAKLIELTEAEAWLKDDKATKGEVLVSDKANLKAESGTYEVTFNVKEEEATKVTVKVTVIDKDIVVEGVEYDIGANNITIGTDQATEMIDDDAILIKATAAEAWEKGDYATKTDVVVEDKKDLKAEEGIYEVEFAVSDEPETKVKVKITVIDEGRVTIGEEYMIVASDFTITTQDSTKITEEQLIELGKARAWQIEDEETAGTVKVTENTVAKKGKGIYYVEFYVDEEKETKVTIKVTVVAPATGRLIISNINAINENIALEGSEFKLLDKDGNVVAENIKTSFTGAATIKNLAEGEYYLVQVKAAEGYQINNLKVKVKISNGGVKTVDFTNYKS
ncbi:hypothetical protein LJB88_05010, partial [Erysipelotrichaceae bacterium OttesenSCG-928-M19]|nr:hypothetical protein [Erysipelotrichaceae bacterium OttesenSCG-928-M19]